jgi:hypothetical protein
MTLKTPVFKFHMEQSLFRVLTANCKKLKRAGYILPNMYPAPIFSARCTPSSVYLSKKLPKKLLSPSSFETLPSNSLIKMIDVYTDFL